jgi:hypothetical protein
MHRQSALPNEGTAWLGFRCAADIAEDAPGISTSGEVDPSTLGIDVPDEESGVPTLEPPPEANPGG